MAEWLVYQKVLCEKIYDELIGDEPFRQLKERAYQALETKNPVGDQDAVSIKDEYMMTIPPAFEPWLLRTIHRNFIAHTSICGINGVDEDKLRITGMWVNRMKKGEQHQPHAHDNSFYSFSAYIEATDQDASFYFINDNQGSPIYINKESIQHILIFPSTLIHTVQRKRTEGDRISVSGNVVIDA